MKYKMCIVVREDLEMSPGKMAVQVAHGCIGLILAGTDKPSIPQMNQSINWFMEGQKKVILRAPDLAALKKVEAKADFFELPNYRVEDFGLTELEPNTITCLAIGPADDATMKPVTGRLKLW